MILVTPLKRVTGACMRAKKRNLVLYDYSNQFNPVDAIEISSRTDVCEKEENDDFPKNTLSTPRFISFTLLD